MKKKEYIISTIFNPKGKEIEEVITEYLLVVKNNQQLEGKVHDC